MARGENIACKADLVRSGRKRYILMNGCIIEVNAYSHIFLFNTGFVQREPSKTEFRNYLCVFI